jgi:hypothetical protein
MFSPGGQAMAKGWLLSIRVLLGSVADTDLYDAQLQLTQSQGQEAASPVQLHAVFRIYVASRSRFSYL